MNRWAKRVLLDFLFFGVFFTIWELIFNTGEDNIKRRVFYVLFITVLFTIIFSLFKPVRSWVKRKGSE
jgi:hypothetical protein